MGPQLRQAVNLAFSWLLVSLLGFALLGCASAASTDRGGSGNAGADPAVRHVLLQLSQSNGETPGANDPPPGLPEPAIPYWRRVFGGGVPNDDIADSELTTLRVTNNGTNIYHGPELAMALGVRAEGFETAVIKICARGQDVDTWMPGGVHHELMLGVITDAHHALEARFPSEILVWHLSFIAGENSANDTSEDRARAWAANFRSLLASIESHVGQTIHPHITRIHSGLPSDYTWKGTVRSQQAVAAQATNGFLIDADGYEVQADTVHRTGAGANANGSDVAASVLVEIRTIPLW